MDSHRLQRASSVYAAITTNHEDNVTVEGLEDLFKWAAETLADGEDSRVKRAREQKAKKQVLELIERVKTQHTMVKAADEVAYLQRRVIALLQRLTETTEENAILKQVMVAQFFALEVVPKLEEEVKRLKEEVSTRERAGEERQELMKALMKVKAERDFLEELVQVNEEENSRLSALLSESRAHLEKLRSRRWWHIFLPGKAK